jgi:hypothetical protein
MIERHLGPGFAPCVGFWDGLLYVAWGTETDKLQIAVFTLDGVEVRRQTVSDGHFSSFPRIDGPWLVYKAYPSLAPVALHLVTGERREIAGVADGNWPVVVDGALGLVAWQTAPDYRLTVTNVRDLQQYPLAPFGAPDGLDHIRPDVSIALRKDIALEAPEVGGYVQRAGDLRVGQYGFGVGVKLDGWTETRWLWGGSEASDPRVAATLDGPCYAIASWGTGVRLAILSREDLWALPRVPSDTPAPPPPPPPPPPPEPPVSIPDHSHIARAVSDAQPHLLRENSKASITELLWRTVSALADHDPNWGFLTKSDGENHTVIEGHRVAVDAVAYRGQVPVVDLFGSAGDGPGTGRLTWGVDPHRRATNLWLAAIPFPGSVPPPPPPPPPPADDLEALRRELREVSGRALAALVAAEDAQKRAQEAEQRAEEATRQASATAAIVAALVGDLANLKAVGPVDLPIVLSGFRGRAKGDVSLRVK